MKREGKRLSDIVRVINKYRLVKEATPERLRQALEELGPTFIKIGQIMSSRPDLVPKEYCEELKKLRSKVKPMEFSLVTEILNREYNGETWNIFASIEEVPIGSASIAQTHRATLKNGDDVVIKIEREHVYETMTQVLRNEWGFKGINITDSSKDATTYMFTGECIMAGTTIFNNDVARSTDARNLIVKNNDGAIFNKLRESAKYFVDEY